MCLIRLQSNNIFECYEIFYFQGMKISLAPLLMFATQVITSEIFSHQFVNVQRPYFLSGVLTSEEFQQYSKLILFEGLRTS